VGKLPVARIGEPRVEALEFGLATDTATLDQSFRLVHDRYLWRGYATRSDSGRRLSAHNALPSTLVFVARGGARVVGTVTLVPDSPIGLPIDEIYAAEVAALRREDRRLAEVGALAVDRGQPLGLAVVLRLLRILVIHAAEIARLDDLIVTVNPRHVAFYRRWLLFQALGPRRPYDRVNGAPAVALRLDLRPVRALIEAVQAGRPRAPLYDFFFGRPHFNLIVRRLRRELPRSVMTPAQVAHFFGDGVALTDATPAQRAMVRARRLAVDRAPGPAPAPGSWGGIELRPLVVSPGVG
jgi:hypothetical protein